MISAALATATFNIKRSLKPAHGFWILGLALFPTALGWLVVENAPEVALDARAFMLYLYVTIVRVVTPLALLLWATPAVHNELENGTWPFIAIRPKGRMGLLLGSYLSAVFWALVTGFIALVLATLVLRPASPMTVVLIIGELVLWSAIAYGAVYSLIGVVFLKRGIPIAVAYTLMMEVVLTLVNAVINEMTVAYRLHTIGLDRLSRTSLPPLDIDQIPPVFKVASIDTSSWAQVGILIAYTAVALFAGAYLLHRRELALAER